MKAKLLDRTWGVTILEPISGLSENFSWVLQDGVSEIYAMDAVGKPTEAEILHDLREFVETYGGELEQL